MKLTPADDKLTIELKKRLKEEIPETPELKRRFKIIGSIVISERLSRKQSKAEVQTEN